MAVVGDQCSTFSPKKMGNYGQEKVTSTTGRIILFPTTPSVTSEAQMLSCYSAAKMHKPPFLASIPLMVARGEK